MTNPFFRNWVDGPASKEKLSQVFGSSIDGVLAFGASDGINYRKTPAWSAEVMRLTQGRGADVIVDLGGKDTLAESGKSLAYDGTVSIVGGLTGYDGSVATLPLLLKTARAQGVYVGSRAELLRMYAFIDKHRVKPLIERAIPFEQFDEAVKLMASGNFVGKIVLKL